MGLGWGDDAEKVRVANDKPLRTWMGSNAFLSIDQQRKEPLFATTAAQYLHIWHQDRSEPIKELSWGDDSLTMARFNPVEKNIIATVGEDRGVILYDIRGNTPIRKLTMSVLSLLPSLFSLLLMHLLRFLSKVLHPSSLLPPSRHLPP